MRILRCVCAALLVVFGQITNYSSFIPLYRFCVCEYVIVRIYFENRGLNRCFYTERSVDLFGFKCTITSNISLDPYDFKSKWINCYFTFVLCYKLHTRLPYSHPILKLYCLIHFPYLFVDQSNTILFSTSS